MAGSVHQRLQRSSGPLPTHCEAYPVLSMPAVASHLRAGEPFCEWFDEFGGLSGQMDAEMLDEVSLQVLSSCGADTYRHQRSLRLRTHLYRQRSGRLETRVHCPECHRLSVRLFLRGGRQACQRCHGLVERRVLLSEAERLILRRDALIRRVHGPESSRGFSMQERARRELMAINEVYAHAYEGEAWPKLPVPLRHALRPVWFGSDEDRSAPEPEGQTWAYLDAVAQTAMQAALKSRRTSSPTGPTHHPLPNAP